MYRTYGAGLFLLNLLPMFNPSGIDVCIRYSPVKFQLRQELNVSKKKPQRTIKARRRYATYLPMLYHCTAPTVRDCFCLTFYRCLIPPGLMYVSDIHSGKIPAPL